MNAAVAEKVWQPSGKGLQVNNFSGKTTLVDVLGDSLKIPAGV